MQKKNLIFYRYLSVYTSVCENTNTFTVSTHTQNGLCYLIKSEINVLCLKVIAYITQKRDEFVVFINLKSTNLYDFKEWKRYTGSEYEFMLYAV